MKIWRLIDEDGGVVAETPVSELIDPIACADGRCGFGVYEALDSSGSIIYTGRTSNLEARLRSHSTQSPWWGFASEIRWMPTANYGETVALERLGISTDHGDWNMAGHVDLPDRARQVVPSAMADRLAALYAASSAHGRSPDLDNYIRTARELGWTLSAIARPLSITRETVRLRALKGFVDYDLSIPSPPARVVQRQKIWPTLRPGEGDELRRLYALASRVRGNTALGHPNRIASERLSELIADLRLRGVRTREIAAATGVTKAAIDLRLARHGYTKNPPSQGKYRPGTGRAQQDKCGRGHELVDDNIRFINGDPRRRICRACEQVRVERYQAKQRRAS